MTVINFNPPKKSGPPPASWSEFGRLLSSVQSCAPKSNEESISPETKEVIERSLYEAIAIVRNISGLDGGRIA